MASLTLPFFSSISSLENTTDKKSFCKFECKLPMKMKTLKISLKCSSSKKDIEVKMKREIEDNNAISIVAAAAADDAEELSFFNSFIEGVVKKLYLPEHSNVIKYGHWKHLAYCSLKILFPGPYDLDFKKNESVEKGIEEGSFYEFIHDDEKIGKIILMEKHFAYTLDDKEIETMKYYDVIEKKKQTLKDEAEEKMKQKLKEEEEEKTRNENVGKKK